MYLADVCACVVNISTWVVPMECSVWYVCVCVRCTSAKVMVKEGWSLFVKHTEWSYRGGLISGVHFD